MRVSYAPYNLYVAFPSLTNMKKKENKKTASYDAKFKTYKQKLRDKGKAKKHTP